MSRKFLGKPLATADMATPPVVAQKVSFSSNKLLKIVRATVIFYNDPAFTDLAIRVYGDRQGSPGKLLHTTAARTKAELMTAQDHGFKNAWFAFDTPIPLRAGTQYHFVLWATGYTGDASSHVAWANGYPDPVYQEGVTMELKEANRFPLDLTFISAEA